MLGGISRKISCAFSGLVNRDGMTRITARNFCRETPSKKRVFLGSPYIFRVQGESLQSIEVKQYRAIPSGA